MAHNSTSWTLDRGTFGRFNWSNHTYTFSLQLSAIGTGDQTIEGEFDLIEPFPESENRDYLEAKAKALMEYKPATFMKMLAERIEMQEAEN